MGVELKLIEGLPHHKVPRELYQKRYDLIFLLAKLEETPWLLTQETEEKPWRGLIKETADYVFGIFINKQPEEENPVVNIEHAFSLTEMDCSRLVDELREISRSGHRPQPYKTEASGVKLNLEIKSSDIYWLSVEYPGKMMSYDVSDEDLSQICELLSGKLKEKI